MYIYIYIYILLDIIRKTSENLVRRWRKENINEKIVVQIRSKAFNSQT